MTHTVLEEKPTESTIETDTFLDGCGFGSGRCPYCEGPETD